MKNKSQTVRIPRGCLWKSPTSVGQEATGRKVHLCWPTLKDLAWFEDVKSILESGGTPRYVTHPNGRLTWHFKLSCYHGDEGWWFQWDDERSARRAETYRMFIPSQLKFHPDYEQSIEEV